MGLLYRSNTIQIQFSQQPWTILTFSGDNFGILIYFCGWIGRVLPSTTSFRVRKVKLAISQILTPPVLLMFLNYVHVIICYRMFFINNSSLSRLIHMNSNYQRLIQPFRKQIRPERYRKWLAFRGIWYMYAMFSKNSRFAHGQVPKHIATHLLGV